MNIKKTITEIDKFFLENKINVKHIKTDRSAYLYTLHFLVKNTVRPKKLLKLEQDISFLLGVEKVRITISDLRDNTLAIEIPKEKRGIVKFNDILGSKEFIENKGELKFALGENLKGEFVVKDLTEMTHLLIAGQTGSGKSVFLNTIINCLIQNKECDFIMVDTKKVELSSYSNLNSLLFPVCEDTEKTITALTWVVNEMEKRYKNFEKVGVKDLKEYIKKTKKNMHRIVIIIDELADLMMQSGKEMETLICRIAQLSRACGIHLIIATQRPSREVLTGLIKVNLPTRVAFSVNSKINSRIILDENGAEQLLGKGDMLYLQAGKEKERIQSAYISSKEIEENIKNANRHIKKIVKKQDILLENVMKYLKLKRKHSINSGELVETFKISEKQASDLMNKLEKQHIVGKFRVFAPREVFLDKIKF